MLTELRQGAGKPAGTLKVALAQTVGRDHVVPLLGEFLRRYPEVLPELHFDNRQVDLVAQGFDVANGGGIEHTHALVSRHAGWLRRSLATGRLMPWALKNAEGEALLAPVRGVMVLDDPEVLAHAAATGAGIAMLPLPHALPLLDSGALVRVLRACYGETQALSVCCTSRKLVPAKLRVFIDFIVPPFQAQGQTARFSPR